MTKNQIRPRHFALALALAACSGSTASEMPGTGSGPTGSGSGSSNGVTNSDDATAIPTLFGAPSKATTSDSIYGLWGGSMTRG